MHEGCAGRGVRGYDADEGFLDSSDEGEEQGRHDFLRALELLLPDGRPHFPLGEGRAVSMALCVRQDVGDFRPSAGRPVVPGEIHGLLPCFESAVRARDGVDDGVAVVRGHVVEGGVALQAVEEVLGAGGGGDGAAPDDVAGLLSRREVGEQVGAEAGVGAVGCDDDVGFGDGAGVRYDVFDGDLDAGAIGVVCRFCFEFANAQSPLPRLEHPFPLPRIQPRRLLTVRTLERIEIRPQTIVSGVPRRHTEMHRDLALRFAHFIPVPIAISVLDNMQEIVRRSKRHVVESVMRVEEAFDVCCKADAGCEPFALGRDGGFEDGGVVALAFEEDGDEEAGAGAADLWERKGCEMGG